MSDPPDTTTDVAIPLEAPVADLLLRDPAQRERAGRIISRLFRREAGVARLFATMDALSDEARRRGLTDEILQEELEAYNAERRDRPAREPEEGKRLAAEFRAARRGRTLGGLRPKDLITKGRDPEPTDAA